MLIYKKAKILFGIIINLKLYKMKKFLENFLIDQMLKSKKFWYTVIAVIVTFLHETFGLDPVQTESILYSIMALVLGQGIADAAKSKK